MADEPIALLIDAENISVRYLSHILGIALSVGTPIIRRVIGDFSQGKLQNWQREALANGFSIDHEPSGGAGKNTADIRLTIVAMDIAASGLVAGFCIASNDRDFSPLVRRLREGGHVAHGIGFSLADINLRGACSAFHVLPDSVTPKPVTAKSSPSKPAPAKPPLAKPTQARAALGQVERQQVCQLLATLCDSSGALELSAVGKILREKHPDIAKKLGGAGLGKRLLALDATGLRRVDGAIVLAPRKSA